MTWSAPMRFEESGVVRRSSADHPGTRRLGNLHRRRTHATRRAMDEHSLAGLDFSRLVQRPIRGLRGDGHAGGFFEGHGCRLARQAVERNHRVLGVTSALSRESQHLVADFPAGNSFTQRVDNPGDIGSRHQPQAPRCHLPVDRIHSCRAHLDEHFARACLGHRQFLHGKRTSFAYLHAPHFLGGSLRGQAENHHQGTEDRSHENSFTVCLSGATFHTDMAA